jgi:hyperosmotically inducible periplasmic protein
MNRFTMTRTTALMAALLMAGTLGACNRRDDSQTAGQKVDAAVAKADEKIDDAKVSAEKAVVDAKKAGAEAMDTAATAVGDTAITASVKAGLAADAALSTVDVGVETRDGRVVLRGKAPDDAARDRATQLAMAVKGVVGVDNQITTVR